ncbi:hypothetical protein FEDK69T_24330 [Flavobacterium enshiense DK69]|nr:oligosaccharide flippase family protein [Flavobacterium enshiense]ESU22440.1 hypothetical protein FEDK69T_24330 [Flavobacterium enshiense DK69]
MFDSKSSYRQILKATSIFGGVQFFTILISIVRSKIIAVLLGPSGLGIATLLNSTIGLINGFTGVGLETSAVKRISEVNSDEDPEVLGKEVGILNRLLWITGLFGMCITIILSPWLSELLFDSDKYVIAIVWISAAVLFKQLSGGQMAVLQGLRKLNYLAKANLLGNLLGLIITIPLYYYWKIDAIAPAIVISSFTGLIFSWLYRRKTEIKIVKITSFESFSKGKELIRIGILLSLSGLLTTLSGYLLQLCISYNSGVTEVGYYNAGFAILNSYVGMIFTAMSTDYFPRLSSFSNDNNKMREIVNQQAYVGILLITPIVVVFLAFIPLIVSLLYSPKFYAIMPMLSWGIIGMLFRTVSWSMGFILLVKGESRVFVKTAIFFNAISLLINIGGYMLWGLEGLGIGFMIYFFIHFIGLKIITKRKYDFSFENKFYRIFLCSVGLSFAAFSVLAVSNFYLKYGLMGLIIIISLILTFAELNKKVDLKEILEKIRRK